MGEKSYTDDDFKKIIKKLFSEKKRNGESKEDPKELFYAKVEKLQTVALEEELLEIKKAFAELTEEQQFLLQQIEKTKSALAKSEQEREQLQEKVRRLGEENQETTKANGIKEQEWLSHSERWGQEKGNLEKKCAKIQQQLVELGEERDHFQENYQKLEKVFKQNQRHFREESEGRFSEIQLLQEKLARAEQQLQQTDLAKIHEEYEKKWAHALEEHRELVDKYQLRASEARAEKELLVQELSQVKQSAALTLDHQEKQLQEGHQAVHAWITRCNQLEEECGRLKSEVARSSHLEQGVKELEAEVHKAQVHLAKKVKESALLQDVAEKQREQILEAQKQWSRETERRLALEKSVDGYQQKEDELKSYAKQCNQEAVAVIEGLESRSALLDQEIEKQSIVIRELEKYKEAYDKLLATLEGITK